MGQNRAHENKPQETVFTYWNGENRDYIDSEIPQNQQGSSSKTWHRNPRKPWSRDALLPTTDGQQR